MQNVVGLVAMEPKTGIGIIYTMGIRILPVPRQDSIRAGNFQETLILRVQI